MVYLTAKGSLTVQVDKGDSDKSHDIQFSTATYNHLDYGYAATIHKSQGITVDRSFVLASQYLDRHASYVALTRHRDGAEIFWSKDEFPSYDAMTNALGRERSKDITLDHVSWEFDKASFAAHRGLDTL
jgi:ATP-dependent exoDNAse (exonuclease V) alpha subunit